MDKFWVVWNPRRSGPTYRHESFHAAKIEAERLARISQGEVFVVLESLEFCKVELVPVKWEKTDDIPF